MLAPVMEFIDSLSDHLPLKQGLKHVFCQFINVEMTTFRSSSIKTRIETKKRGGCRVYNTAFQIIFH